MALPEVIAARSRMIRTAKAWQAVAPDDDHAAEPLTDGQLMLLVEALSAQKTYIDVKEAAQQANVVRLP
jgi:hypothetical protein